MAIKIQYRCIRPGGPSFRADGPSGGCLLGSDTSGMPGHGGIEESASPAGSARSECGPAVHHSPGQGHGGGSGLSPGTSASAASQSHEDLGEGAGREPALYRPDASFESWEDQRDGIREALVTRNEGELQSRDSILGSLTSSSSATAGPGCQPWKRKADLSPSETGRRIGSNG